MKSVRKLAFVAILLTTTSCSLLIDVEPDCDTVSSCTPYACNELNTACLDSCRTDSDCATGYICRHNSDVCTLMGCREVTEPIRLTTISNASFEYDVALTSSSFWLLVGTESSVGLMEVTLGGTVVGGEGAIVVLDTSPTSPVQPQIVGAEGGISAFWVGSTGPNVSDIRAFRLEDDGLTVGPRVVYQGELSQNIDNLSVGLTSAGIGLSWATFIGRSRLQALVLNTDTTYGQDNIELAPNNAAVVISSEDVGATLPSVTLTETGLAVAFRASDGGFSSVDVNFVDDELAEIGQQRVSNYDESTLNQVTADDLMGSVVVAWIEISDGVYSLMRAITDETEIVLHATVSEDFTTVPNEATLAAGSNEFALAFTAQSDGVEDVFLRRFDEFGNPLFVTFAVSGGTATDPSDPIVVRTADGYSVFWIEESSSSRGLYYRRYTCGR